jgi:signal-transduction protein with cAMP-binding, CBS, and nucleotidyltransferase domain
MLVSAAMRLEYLTPNDWALLRSRSRTSSFRKGEVIIPINSKPDALFILKKGSATVEVTRGTVIARLTAGDICGEMAFIENSVASASVVAETETEVDAFHLSQVSEIFSSYPHLEARFYKSVALLLSRRLRRTSSELAKSISKG